jgi:hypothetical protein
MTELSPSESGQPNGYGFRAATAADVARVVALLADDPLGAGREAAAADPRYQDAFKRIEADPNNGSSSPNGTAMWSAACSSP